MGNGGCFSPRTICRWLIAVLYSKTQVNHLLLAVNCLAVLRAPYVINWWTNHFQAHFPGVKFVTCQEKFNEFHLMIQLADFSFAIFRRQAIDSEFLNYDSGCCHHPASTLFNVKLDFTYNLHVFWLPGCLHDPTYELYPTFEVI